MASRKKGTSRFARRILWLAVAVVAAFLAYTALWFTAARSLERELAAAIAELNGGGVRAHCEEPEARGYPFRIGLFCRSVFYENVRSGISVRAGAFRSAAQVYQPFRVVGEVDAPAAVTLPIFEPLEIRWANLRASARLADPLPERTSLEAREVVVSEQEGGTTPLARLAAVEAHARRQDGDLETAASFRDLFLGAKVAPDLPPLEGRARVLIEDGATLAETGRFDPYGRSGEIQELVVGVTGQKAQLSLSGPVSIDEDGLIDAELSVRLRDPAAVLQLLSRIFPDARDEITAAASGLSGMEEAPLQIGIRRGRVFLGFIPLGRIPPI